MKQILLFFIPIIFYIIGFQILHDDNWREFVGSAMFIIGAHISIATSKKENVK